MAKQLKHIEETLTDKEVCLRAYDSFERNHDINGIKFVTPQKPEIFKISGYGKKKKNRKFPYLDLKIVRELSIKNGKKLMRVELPKRKGGFWFFNGDNLEYVTGDHYMLLQYWTIEGDVLQEDGTTFMKEPRQADWMDMQRDWHYAWESIKYDADCFGLLFLGRRRTAKTEMAISAGYWHATSGMSKKFFIQSKTDDDTKEVLAKIVNSWQQLPYIWRPTDTQETDVSKGIRFREPKRSTAKVAQSKRRYKKVLRSEITAKPSGTVGIDGLFASLTLNDEIFKTKKSVADVKKRYYVNKKAMASGQRIVGKAILTSTVEEMEKDGIEIGLSLWNQSKLETTNPNTNRTISGLYSLFFPAYYGLTGEYKGKPLMDEWGYSNQDLSKEYLIEERKGLEGEDLINEKRKNPFDEFEAFYTDTSEEVFSQEALRSQDRFNINTNAYEKEVRVGNFYWKDGIKWGDVLWRDDPKGRWTRSIDSPLENRNKHMIRGFHKAPTGNGFYTAADPVDHGKVRHGKGSQATLLTIAKSDPERDVFHDSVACVYSYRHADPNMYYEDAIMQCYYYNSPFLAENQKHGIINAFEDKKYGAYCMFDPLELDPKKRNKNKGIPTTGSDHRNALIRFSKTYINSYVGYQADTNTYGVLPYKELLNQLLYFDASNWTPSDLVVAFMIAICASRSVDIKPASQMNMSQFIPGQGGIKGHNLSPNSSGILPR
jgi:hypothetical protein|tara:strand:+ start:2633 stop:4774 length:2142 start_codon:yes stop_codon:yes gene_type:complete